VGTVISKRFSLGRGGGGNIKLKHKIWTPVTLSYSRKQSALGVAKGFAHIEGKSIFGGKLGYLNSGFVKQMGLEKVRCSLNLLILTKLNALLYTVHIKVSNINLLTRKS
jgi:hypothetical protein